MVIIGDFLWCFKKYFSLLFFFFFSKAVNNVIFSIKPVYDQPLVDFFDVNVYFSFLKWLFQFYSLLRTISLRIIFWKQFIQSFEIFYFRDLREHQREIIKLKVSSLIGISCQYCYHYNSWCSSDWEKSQVWKVENIQKFVYCVLSHL